MRNIRKALAGAVVGFALLLGVGTVSQATNKYAGPSGSGTSPCTSQASPCVLTSTTLNNLSAGDTLYLLDGTYTLSGQLSISVSGSGGSPITLTNLPGALPILDATSTGNDAINLNGVSWWVVKGLEVKNAPSNGIHVQGTNPSNITIERNVTHHNSTVCTSGCGGIMADSLTSSNLLILNNDSHDNGIAATSGGDGIGVPYTQQTGNVIRGNRVWHNNDDGIDLFDAANILVEHNWSWENGLTGGNGIGIKCGGGNNNTDGNHTVQQNLVWGNASNGIDENTSGVPSRFYNNTSWDNGTSAFENYAFGSGQNTAHILRNNIALPNSASFDPNTDDQFNSWNLAVTVTTGDFQTMDFSAAVGARESDGSLPTISFLRLVSGSDLINVGTNVGLSFSGAAPDLGAYEFSVCP